MDFNNTFLEKTKELETPFAIYSLNQISSNINSIQSCLPGVDIYYAMKANPHQRIVEHVRDMGIGFEIASLDEAMNLIDLGVDAQKIICLHPIKSRKFLEYLHQNEIDVLAADSYEEVDKIAKYAPGSKIVARVTVNNDGSLWNLNGKFGIGPAHFPDFFDYILSVGLVPYGLTFHVGSQCENVDNWVGALRVCRDIWQEAQKIGITSLKLLSLGGGLPASYASYNANLTSIGDILSSQIDEMFSEFEGIEVSIEPGRAIVANSAILGTEIFGVVDRSGINWAYIETGIMNYLHEAFELNNPHFYPLLIDSSREKKKYTIGGPSCMTLDTPFRDVELPELREGERLYIGSVGAYTETCSVNFNGFPVPKVYFWEEM